jgi:hypothetical protein
MGYILYIRLAKEQVRSRTRLEEVATDTLSVYASLRWRVPVTDMAALIPLSRTHGETR